MTTGDGMNDVAGTARPGGSGAAAAVADPAYGGAAAGPAGAGTVPGEPPLAFMAAPFRHASVVERTVRVLAALLLVAYSAVSLVAAYQKPRRVESIDAMFRDANAGRMTRIDLREGVRWRNRGGAVYEFAGSSSSLRDDVLRQPYVAAHPGSVTFGPVDVTTDPLGEWSAMFWFPLAILLGIAREPRYLTRWAWFWVGTLGHGLGFAAYLLLAGSLRRSRPEALPKRVGGGRAFVAGLVVTGVLSAGWVWAYNARHPVPTTGTFYAPQGLEQ